MKNIDLGQSIGILANIGVIAGIIFLGLELRQNNEYLDTQISQQFFQNRITLSSDIIRDPSLAELLVKANAGEALTPAEELRALTVSRRILLNLEWEFSQFELGRINELPIEVWRQTLQNGRMEEIWNNRAANLAISNPSFLKFIEENVLNER